MGSFLHPDPVARADGAARSHDGEDAVGGHDALACRLPDGAAVVALLAICVTSRTASPTISRVPTGRWTRSMPVVLMFLAEGAVGKIHQAQRSHPVHALLRQEAHLAVPRARVGVPLDAVALDQPDRATSRLERP